MYDLFRHPVTLSPCHPVTLSPCHPVTLSPCHPVTLSPCHPVTLSPCHPEQTIPAQRTNTFAEALCLLNEGNEIAEEVPLSEAFTNPSLVTENGIDSMIKYLASDPSSELDLQVVDGVRNFLFGPPGAGGFDLVSLNIQRGPDVGLADYNSTRESYGLELLSRSLTSPMTFNITSNLCTVRW